MNGGSTIVEFWRDEGNATGNAPAADDILLLKQAVLDIDDAPDDAQGEGEKLVRNARIGLGLLAALWLGFALWATIVSDQWRAGPAAWPALVATLLVPISLLGIAYLLIVRNSRAESRRYLDTAHALRTEAELLELRLGRIADRLESARQTMQDQAELLDSYGAAASSNMEASAELIAGRAQTTADRAESAERAGTALVARMDTLIAAMPQLEERAVRMAAQIMDNGHALAERIDTLEARLHALGELSDDTRTRTLSATKSLSSQLGQLQETTRSATDEVNGLADIAAGRIETSAQSARAAMDQTRQDIDAQSAALDVLVNRVALSLGETSDGAVRALTQDLDLVEASLRGRLETSMDQVRDTMERAQEGLSTQRATLEALVARAQASITATSQNALAALGQDLGSIEDDLRQRLDATLLQARETLALTDAGLRDQAGALDSLITRSRDSIAAIGTDTVAGLADDIGEVESRLHQINDLVEGQRSLMAGLHGTLNQTIDQAEARFAALEDNALARSQKLTDALTRLTEETRRIDTALHDGGTTAEKLIGNAETLMVALDSSVRELDETYPGALARFDARLETSRAMLGAATPELERLEAISEALVGRTQEAEEMLRGQGRRLSEWLESTQSGIESNRELVEKLRTALDAAHEDTTRITEGAGPLLITALLRVKDTAEQAAERARQALGRAIPDAVQNLAEASEQAMQQAVGDQVSAQIEKLADVAEEAVRAAHNASDRLTRQLMTIADTSAGLEQRIEEAGRAAEERDRDHFSRRSALLIESLNSTAIDVAKILSNDVTDTNWSAYLKGDRGVFTRRRRAA